MLKENQHIEFKSGFNDEAMEALVAFANTEGGDKTKENLSLEDYGKKVNRQ